MPRMTQPPWLDEQQPHDPESSELQIDALRELFKGKSHRLLDLGCGTGRVLVPLAGDGHDCVGVDSDPRTIEMCHAELKSINADAALIEADFVLDWPDNLQSAAPFDAVLCLGNTLMTIVDFDAAIEVLCRTQEVLLPGGAVILDDIPGDFWPELTEGNWQSGVSPDGDMQIIWNEADPVFALRQGHAVDTECWDFKDDDRRFRLWTTSLLQLVARQVGLSGVERRPDVGLVLLRKS